MPTKISQIDTLHTYLEGVMGRAEDHAGKVEGAALALAGAVLWKMDQASMRVLVRKGEPKNVLWIAFSGRTLVFSYNHQSEKIEMREDSLQGAVLHSFDNSTSLCSIVNIFRAL